MFFPPRILALVFILLFASSTSRVSASEYFSDYQLGIGDKIKVTVFGENELSELSDELLIDGAGTIRMPLLGAVQVVGKTLAEARALIIEQLEAGFLKNPLVTVGLAELQPIFVLGDVRTSGQHPFKFGLTVLKAVAMAGGFGPERLRDRDAMGGLFAAEERLHLLSRRYANLIVRLARIEAEHLDQKYFDVPKLPQIMSHLDIAELAKRELKRLILSRRSHERLLKLLRDQKPTVKREIDARKQEIISQKELIQIYEAQLSRVSSIKLAARMLELRTQIAQGKGLLSRIRGEIAALEEKSVAVDIRAEEAITKREERITSELADTRQELGEVEASLPSVIETVELRRRQAGQIFETDDWQRNYEIKLKRARTGDIEKISAAEVTDVKPGDTVIVRLVRPSDSGRRSTTIDRSSSPGISRQSPKLPAWKAPRPGT